MIRTKLKQLVVDKHGNLSYAYYTVFTNKAGEEIKVLYGGIFSIDAEKLLEYVY